MLSLQWHPVQIVMTNTSWTNHLYHFISTGDLQKLSTTENVDMRIRVTVVEQCVCVCFKHKPREPLTPLPRVEVEPNSWKAQLNECVSLLSKTLKAIKNSQTVVKMLLAALKFQIWHSKAIGTTELRKLLHTPARPQLRHELIQIWCENAKTTETESSITDLTLFMSLPDVRLPRRMVSWKQYSCLFMPGLFFLLLSPLMQLMKGWSQQLLFRIIN